MPQNKIYKNQYYFDKFEPKSMVPNINIYWKKAKDFYDKQSEVIGDLSFVKGYEWLAGNLSYHLNVRPKWIYNSSNIFLCNKNLECIKYK